MEFKITNMTTDYLNCFTIYRADRMVAWGPLGWYTYVDTRSVGWDASESQYVIPSSSALSGFGFIEDTIPTEYSWWVSGGAGGFTGTVVPTPIPEPSSLLALGSGFLALAGLALRRRRK